MKKGEFKQLTLDELTLKLEEFRKEHANLRFHKSTQQLEKPHQIRVVRRNIARVETAINAKRREKDAQASTR